MEVVDVVMRCRNEMPYAEKALRALAEQRSPRARILFIDCKSTDGSREVAVKHDVRIVDLDPSAYIPGRVLNMGMRETTSDIVAFINADAIALGLDALEALVRPFETNPRAIATYARQLARADADALTQLDYARAFPADAAVRVRHGHFFSMAASAVRRSGWEALPFDEDLRYSEDVDWSLRASALGWESVYANQSLFEHSHVYDLRAQLKRHEGEGRADTQIHHLGYASIVRDFVRPLAGSLLRDVRASAITPSTLATRTAQAAGYYLGRRKGHWRG